MGFIAQGHYGKQGLCGETLGRLLLWCELGVGYEEIEGCLLVHAKISENGHEKLISMLDLVVTWQCCVFSAASAMDENHAEIGGAPFLSWLDETSSSVISVTWRMFHLAMRMIARLWPWDAFVGNTDIRQCLTNPSLYVGDQLLSRLKREFLTEGELQHNWCNQTLSNYWLVLRISDHDMYR